MIEFWRTSSEWHSFLSGRPPNPVLAKHRPSALAQLADFMGSNETFLLVGATRPDLESTFQAAYTVFGGSVIGEAEQKPHFLHYAKVHSGSSKGRARAVLLPTKNPEFPSS